MKLVYRCTVNGCGRCFDTPEECLEHEAECDRISIDDFETLISTYQFRDENIKDRYEAINCLQCENFDFEMNCCKMYGFNNLDPNIKNCSRGKY